MPVSANAEPKRITVTLGRGQYEQLAEIADRNRATLAFVVRRAIDAFLERSWDPQALLHFPEDEADVDR